MKYITAAIVFGIAVISLILGNIKLYKINLILYVILILIFLVLSVCNPPIYTFLY